MVGVKARRMEKGGENYECVFGRRNRKWRRIIFTPGPLFVKREFSPKIGDKMGEKLGLRWEIVKQNLSENQNRQKEEPFILVTLLL